MSIYELLYGFEGRISRSQWWLGQLALVAMLGLFYVCWTGWIATNVLTGELLKSVSPGIRLKILASLLVVSAVLSSLLVWVALSLATKRVHDQGRSGARTLAYCIPLVLVEVVPQTAFTAVALVILVWYVLELGCFAGYPHHNQYGPATTPDDDDVATSAGPVASGSVDITGLIAGPPKEMASRQNAISAVRTGAATPGSAASVPEWRPSAFGRRGSGPALT